MSNYQIGAKYIYKYSNELEIYTCTLASVVKVRDNEYIFTVQESDGETNIHYRTSLDFFNKIVDTN